MQCFISILRGINVGGQRIIKMEELKSLYSDLGFLGCQSYIQSGNVVFCSSEENAKNLESLISMEIANRFNLKVPVIVLKTEELNEIISNNPFLGDPSSGDTHLHITFLSDIPEMELAGKISQSSFLPDRFHLRGKTMYLCCPNGYGNTKFNNTFIENKLKVTATTRNWRTTLELLRMAEKTATLTR